MRSRSSLAVLALYVGTITALSTAFASVLVPTLYLFGPVPIFVLVPFYVIFAADWVGLDARTLAPLVVVAAAILPFLAVGTYGRTDQLPLAGYALETQQAGASLLGIAVLVTVALPFVTRWYAWRQFDEATTEIPTGDDALDALAANVPERLSVRTFDDDGLAAYLVDDGHRAVLGLTTSAREALDDRERDAVAAREITRTVDHAAVPVFWASALALAAARVVRPISTPRYDSRAGGKVRLPYRFVAPLKIVGAIVALLIGCVFGLAALSLLVHVKLLVLALGYAVATVAAGFAVATVADHLAQETAREHVLAADEHGAILADDPAALASALRTLHESDATAIPRANHVGRSTDSHVVADERNVLAALADCPTDRVPLDDRITALEGLQDRLDDRATREPADALSNASS